MRTWVVFILGTMLVSAAPPQSANPKPANTADAQFYRIAEDYIAGYLRWRPLQGTSLGLHQYDGKITDFSKISIEIELSRLKTFERKLDELTPHGLSHQGYFDYRILRSAIQREIFGFEQMKIYEENPMTYASAIDVNTYIKRDFAPLNARLRSIVSILKQTPKIMAAARENLADSLARPKIETAMEEATGVADFLARDLVAAVTGATDAQLKEEFNTVNGQAIQELRGFVSWLKDQKLPKANDKYALGREKYSQMLQYGEMITLPPEKLLELGMNELRRKQQTFAELARQIDSGKKPVAVFKEIQKDHPTEQSLIPDTARDLEMIRQFVIDHHIVTLPSPVRAVVKETPQFLRATSFASMDTPGPFETKAKEAYYYVTPTEPDWTPKQKEEWLTAMNYYTTDIVSIHEAYPGHYVQFLCLNASPATKLEKIFVSYAFSEGWAHYAEQMMIDEGFGKSSAAPLNRDELLKAVKYHLAQTDEALLRVCRLCVSIKMHCEGMTVDQATRFFEDNCYYEEKPARQEAIRGSFDPEYLYYTLGKLEIFKLREDYRKQEGANFNLQSFHDELLRHGAAPLRLMREVMLKDRKTWGDLF